MIITPFGKYKYECLPIGLKYAPDFAQQIVEQVLCRLNKVEVYSDDIGVFGNTLEVHHALLDKVLSLFEANGFTVNSLKCAWVIQETNWHGYWLKTIDLKQWKKHISAILEQEPPCNIKEMRGFFGAVNKYQLMWPKQARLITSQTW